MNGVRNKKLMALFTGAFIAVNSFSVVTPHNDQYLRDAYKLTSATIYTSYSEDYYNEFMTDTNTKLPLKDGEKIIFSFKTSKKKKICLLETD